MIVEFDQEYEVLEVDKFRIADSENICMYTEQSIYNTQTHIINEHWHEWVEIIKVKKGSMTVVSTDESIQVEAGQTIVIGMQTIHKIIGSIGEAEYQCLHINAGFIIKNIGLATLYKKIFLVEDSQFSKYYNNTIEFLKKKDAVSSLKFKGNLLLLVSSMIEMSCDNPVKANSNFSDLFNRILIYVNENYNEDISLNSVSDLFGYSPQYIGTLFRKYLNTTFLSYLMKIRIDKAKFSLYSSNDKITDIAYEGGFLSVHSFISNFKKITGMTPSEFRRRNSNNYNIDVV